TTPTTATENCFFAGISWPEGKLRPANVVEYHVRGPAPGPHVFGGTVEENGVREVIVIGGGPAGYTAALYAARANLHPLVIEGFQWGGQLMITSDVENYPGYPEGIMGPEMMADFRRQAERFGAEFVSDDVTRVDLSERPFRVWVGNVEHRSHTVVVATGANARVEFVTNAVVEEVLGDGKLTSVRLRDTRDERTRDIPADGLFVAIGHDPNTSLFLDQLDHDEGGYLVTKPGSSETNVPGV